MICSPRSNKSGSNWLDRLRSNKGIPTDSDLDLDSFLLKLTTHSPQPRPIKPVHQRPPVTHEDPPLTTVLAHLFDPSAATVTLNSKKCPRKQTNPKIYLASSTTTTTGNAPSTAAPVVEVENRCEVGEDGEEDLKGFTKSEVTVIDTSCQVWKVDKFVFRKNNVWKVRERKQKTKFLAKKKKKSKVTHELHINGIGNSKDNIVNIGGEKAVKKQKVI